MRTAVATARMAVSPPLGCSVHAKDAPNFSARGQGGLRWSLWNLSLSIEMNTKPAISEKETIEFRDVSFHINDIPAGAIVSSISFAVSHGETLVLLGRSGSGKPTLLRLINGMLLPSQGEVFVQERSTRDWDRIRLRPGIGYVIQGACPVPQFTV